MKSSKELKEIAKQNLKGNFGTAIGTMIVIKLISGVPLCGPAAVTGYANFNTKLVRGENPDLGTSMSGFSIFGKSLWLGIISAFFASLWSLLLVIPGIIKAISYSMAPYILAENPTLTAREALRASKALTQGKKGSLFYLYLTFIGWFLLCIPTCGLLGLYVGPYLEATVAAFYDDASKAN